MLLTNETHKIQSALAEYCRTNHLHELPGLTPKRVHHYRRLVYNIINDTFEGAFPITFSLLNSEEWHELVNGFFSAHACRTPSIWKLPYEFFEYFSKNTLRLKEKYPFLCDLIYFEWLEIEVHTMPDEKQNRFTSKGDWLNDRIVINKEFKLKQFEYPVHQYKPADLVDNNRKGTYFVLVFRQPNTGNVQFFDLSPLYAFFITQLALARHALNFIIDQTCALFAVERNQQVDAQLIAFLEQLKQKQFILGFAE